MENAANQKSTNKWLSIPIIATITRLLCRELTLQNEYFLQENEIFKSKITKRINFTDEERRALVESALAMGTELMDKVVRIVQPKTILAWQRRLEKQNPSFKKSFTYQKLPKKMYPTLYPKNLQTC